MGYSIAKDFRASLWPLSSLPKIPQIYRNQGFTRFSLFLKDPQGSWRTLKVPEGPSRFLKDPKGSWMILKVTKIIWVLQDPQGSTRFLNHRLKYLNSTFSSFCFSLSRNLWWSNEDVPETNFVSSWGISEIQKILKK